MEKGYEIIVITEKQVIFTVLKPECLSDEALDEFEKGMFKLDEKDTREESLLTYAAAQISDNEDIHYIDGIGPVGDQYSQRDDIYLRYRVDTLDVSTELVGVRLAQETNQPEI